MSAETDYYAILGVTPDSDASAIRSAYRVLARRHHPDLAGGSDALMTALNAAWSVLRDPHRRAVYDRQRARPAPVADAPADDADAGVARPRPATPGATVLDFGRYQGWTLGDLARHDPDFLEWLARTSIGRRYRTEIDAVLATVTTLSASLKAQRRERRGWLRSFR